ncbi:helix-hairpin-helix domain-containing protein [Streptomyces sp. NPDC017936]|uniref:helix-hairpin-helix domain-containing protein n=1 Tax=Streptomyces sp. NPDC017936 TaxID=3365016 RepID=UPI003796D22F
MALRSRSRTTNATSGPGRDPGSDGRLRHRRSPAHSRLRNRQASAEELRRRAEELFGDRVGRRGHARGTGAGPPTRDDDVGDEAGFRNSGRRAPRPVSGAELAGRREPAAGHGRGASVTVGDGGRAVAAGGGGPAAVGGGGAVSAGAGEPAAGFAGSLGAGEDEGDARAARGVEERWRRAGLALRERMPVWVQARCGLERRTALALAVLVVAVAALAVQHFWSGRAQSVRAPQVVRAAAPYEAEERTAPAGPTGSPGPVGGAGTAAPEIVVDVSGKVRNPGIHRLPAGSRVVDALSAAGGVRPGTNTDGLNRARFLVDGEQVVVGGPAAGGAAGPGTGTGRSAGGPAAGAPAGPVSLSTATVEQLDALPGVGPVLAQHILDYRTRQGGFRSVDELREVNGIGERRFADLRNLVRP